MKTNITFFKIGLIESIRNVHVHNDKIHNLYFNILTVFYFMDLFLRTLIKANIYSRRLINLQNPSFTGLVCNDVFLAYLFRLIRNF